MLKSQKLIVKLNIQIACFNTAIKTDMNVFQIVLKNTFKVIPANQSHNLLIVFMGTGGAAVMRQLIWLLTAVISPCITRLVPTEAKQGWAGQYLDGDSWEN